MAYDHEKLRKYILGQLTEEESDEFGELIVCDTDFADELAAVEADLLDEFVNGELDPAFAEIVRRHYSATEYRRRKLAFATALRDRSATSREVAAQTPAIVERAAPWWSAWARPIWATAALVILATAGVVMWQSRKGDERIATNGENTPAPTTTPAAATEKPVTTITPADPNRSVTPTPGATPETNRNRNTEPAPSVKPVLATFVLRPSMRGEGTVQSLPVAAGTREFAFRLMLEPNDFESFEVALTDQSGATKFWSGNRPKSGSALVVSVRSELPRDQILVFTVRGIRGGNPEPLGTFVFKLENR